jgi:iron complex outermembrane receptor protein
MSQPFTASSSQSLLRAFAAAAPLALLALPLSLSAQAPATLPAEEPVNLEAFVTVGSRFNQRTATDSAVPIDVITEREIRQGGYTETAKVLQAQIPSFNNPHPTTPDGNTHIRSATLRGLSPDQTLVLVNGKRRHTSAWVNTGGTIGRGAVSTDLNAIPSTAIGRIEVLRDGASAQYGSDAIAGVINLVLREDLGLSATGTYGVTKESDGDTWEASLSSGFKLGEGGFFHTTLYHRDRNATNSALPDTRQFYFGRNATTGAVTANSANFGSGTTNPPANTTLDPREATVNRDVWRYGDGDLVENTVFFNFAAPLRPARALELYGFGGLGRSEAVSNASFRRPADNNNVRAIYPNGFLPFVDTDSNNLSIGLGLRGKAGTWDWDLSQEVGTNALKYFTHNTLNASLGVASPTSFYNGRLDFTQAVTNLDFKTSFDAGLPASVKVATGAEFRADRYRIGAGAPDSYRSGGVAVLDGPSAGAVATVGAQGFGGISPRDALHAQRNSTSLYADAETDLTKALRVSAAVRFEDYTDFGTTVNGKLAARLALGGGLAARASVSSGFHAPALQQQYFGSTSSRTDANTNTIILSRVFPVGDPAARALGATELDPEKSINWSGGLVYEQGGFTATADAYQISIDDRLFLSSQFTGAAVQSYLTAQGIPGVEGARFFTNAADTRTRGLDLTLRERLKLGTLGRLTITSGFNYNTTTLTRVRPTPASVTALGITTPLFDITERIRATRGQPRTNAQLALAWDIGRWSFLARGVRYGDYEAVALTNLAPAQVALFPAGSNFRTLPTETVGAAAGNVDVIGKFDARILTDLDLAYRLAGNLTLSVGANNAFNIHPPEVIRSTPARLGADAGGVFRYSEFSPFPYSGAFYYTRVSVTF